MIIVPKHHFYVIILKQIPGNFHEFRITSNEQKSLVRTERVTHLLNELNCSVARVSIISRRRRE